MRHQKYKTWWEGVKMCLNLSCYQLKQIVINIIFCSVAKSCPTLCDPMDHSKSAFPVLYYLLKFAQTHVHDDIAPLMSITHVSDALQPSHPLSHASPHALNLS